MKANRMALRALLAHIRDAAERARDKLANGGDLIDVPYEALDPIESDIRLIRRIVREDVVEDGEG